jgi:hypothetical protein
VRRERVTGGHGAVYFAARIGMGTLRLYLAAAMILVIVRIVHVALGH